MQGLGALLEDKGSLFYLYLLPSVILSAAKNKVGLEQIYYL